MTTTAVTQRARPHRPARTLAIFPSVNPEDLLAEVRRVNGVMGKLLDETPPDADEVFVCGQYMVHHEVSDIVQEAP